ncbi:hypothetical protein K1T71_012236 [Dendrolimus kikuchii]|uniref:Uncharacterized protein n=1 Tax=Dendrolimus kikuchii TaxID=765133 RepID=A0ACC1CKY1_9NEOP|nr:hypothetical protein K1T71_012236 [Dendrolimus kikuchii]
MIEDVAKDYSAYLKLDVANGFNTVQDVVDNMLTRLEELTSVLQMVKLKNSDCSRTVSEDISKYRNEIGILSKKIAVLSNVLIKLHNNVETLEKQVEKAEVDFGVNNDYKIKSFLMPFLKRNRDVVPSNVVHPVEKVQLESVMSNFDETL